MGDWKVVRLGDFMLFNPTRTLKKNTVAKKVTMDKLVSHSKVIYEYSLSPYNGGSKFINGDTIMARITPCLENGKHAYVSFLDEGEVGFGSTEYIVMRGKENISDNEFVYYLSKTPCFKNTAVKSMVGSSGRQRAQIDVLENLEMKVPPLSCQRRISSLLSSLDDKIGVNRAICRNLEEQAQALFKEWFVDFAPFKGRPFVDTELGRIPEGWKVGTLGDVGTVVGGGTPSKGHNEYYTSNGIAWLTPRDLSVKKNKFTSKGAIDITSEGYKNSSTKLMPKGSVLFSSRAPIGYITIAKNDICTNQGFKSVVPTNAGTAFIYYVLKTNTKRIENMSSGTTFIEASGSLIKSLSIVIPKAEVLDEFEQIADPIFKQQMILEEESSRLSQLRDTMLPRLMSGELAVPCGACEQADAGRR